MKKIETKNEARTINGGSRYYCTICGYGWYNNYSYIKLLGHLFSSHPEKFMAEVSRLIRRLSN